MPGVEEEEGDDKVEEIGRHQGNDKSEEYLILPHIRNGESVSGELGLYRLDRYEDGGEHEVSNLSAEFRTHLIGSLHHDESPENYHGHIESI